MWRSGTEAGAGMGTAVAAVAVAAVVVVMVNMVLIVLDCFFIVVLELCNCPKRTTGMGSTGLG